MSALTGDTDVFIPTARTDRAAVMFLARRQPGWRQISRPEHARAVESQLGALSQEGWRLSIRQMIDPDAPVEATALDTGFAHRYDMAGVFEAPNLGAAMAGTIRLERAGWERFFTTEWLLGPREFAPITGARPNEEKPWGFFALWEWNDAWAAASPAERTAYDLECDVAFKGDLALSVNIAGRHRLDWASSWHHLGAWEIGAPETIDAAITGHEHARDFMFTTSRHLMGPIRRIAEFLEPD